jgi:hypothetical protein
MYINNPESVPNMECNFIVANYLLEKGVPILSRKNNKYYFADSMLVRNLLKTAPFYIKFMKEKLNILE